MGLFCLNCDFVWGRGPGVPSIIHEKTCAGYDEVYYRKHYPKLDIERAQFWARRYGKREYALKMHTLSPAYEKKRERQKRNKLRWKARRGDLKAKRRLRPQPSRMLRTAACRMRSRTREFEHCQARGRIMKAWLDHKITVEQYREEQKKLLEIFRAGASREELKNLYQDL